MGKAAKRRRKAAKRKQVWEPDIENPVCPTCAGNDQLDAETDESGIIHCNRCNINFWMEEGDEAEPVGPEDDGDWTPCGACRGKGCHLCLPSGPPKKSEAVVVSAHPVLGKMVEL